MLFLIKSIILGIIQGITEFLPVSSTGHLIIIEHYLKLSTNKAFTDMFDVVIQAGSIIAVVLYFRKIIFSDIAAIKRFDWKSDFLRLWLKIFVGFAPAIIIGALCASTIKEKLYAPAPVACALIIGALLLLYAESKLKTVKVSTVDEIKFKHAVIIGLFQCLAFWPGMSRSGATIIGGLLIGFSRTVAAEFSFFLSIPTILAAAAHDLLKVFKSGIAFSHFEWTALIIATAVSFIVSYLVISALMNFIIKQKFVIFAYYRIILGIIVLIFAK